MNTKNLKIMGIVGIRSGSKGVPGKNVKMLCGQPLVSWILGTAKTSRFINRLVVSTDSQKYARIAEKFGAEIPCLRPSSLATDTSTDYEYVAHMVEWLEKNESYRPDIVVRMMATSPLQSVSDIDCSIEKLIVDREYESCVVVSEARQHPNKALKIIEDINGKANLVSYFTQSGREVTPVVRQYYEKAYFRSNVITFRRAVLSDTLSLTGDRVAFQLTTQENAIDIDSELDFEFAEYLLKRRKPLEK
jgi:N-acylneuraminate cytidylyltransferase/CMP-N,N'-diacetyllegionaminic acid synthase